jgi:serine/threonine protein kinase
MHDIETSYKAFYTEETTTRLIGEGAYARVYSLSDSPVVVKQSLGRSTDLQVDFVREVCILYHLRRSEFVLNIRGFDSVARSIFMAKMDYSLSDYMASPRFDLGVVPHIMASLLSGMQDLHASGIWHMDIKPDNILLNMDRHPPEVRLADFGLARKRSPFGRRRSMVYTLWYRAPEIVQCIRTERDRSSYDGMRTDLYAIGVCLWDLLTVGAPALAAQLRGSTVQEQSRRTRTVLGPTDCVSNTRPVGTTACLDEAGVCHQARMALADRLRTITTDDGALDLLAGMLHPDPRYRYEYRELVEHAYLRQTSMYHRSPPVVEIQPLMLQASWMPRAQLYCDASEYAHRACAALDIPDRVYYLGMATLRYLCAHDGNPDLALTACCAVYLSSLFIGLPTKVTQWVRWARHSAGPPTFTIVTMRRRIHACFRLVYPILCQPTVHDLLGQFSVGTSALARMEHLGLAWYLHPTHLAAAVVWASTGTSTRAPVYSVLRKDHTPHTLTSYGTVATWMSGRGASPRIYFVALAVLRHMMTHPACTDLDMTGYCALHVASVVLDVHRPIGTWRTWSEAVLTDHVHEVVRVAHSTMCTPTVWDVLATSSSSVRRDVEWCLAAFERLGLTWHLDPDAIVRVVTQFVAGPDRRAGLQMMLENVRTYLHTHAPEARVDLDVLYTDYHGRPSTV